MEDLSNFARGQIVGARLAAAPVTRIATLLDVSTAKSNSGPKSTVREGDCRTLGRAFSKNHTTTHPEDPVSTEIVRHEFHKSTSMAGLHLLTSDY
jgi:hypothetical protein